jgi:hypothetical protein
MVTNEVFIDSATLRENIVSLARNIGYVPRSRRSSRARISFFVDTRSLSIRPTTLKLKKGLVSTTSNSFDSQSYSFVIPSDITVEVKDSIAYFDDIEIYEGSLITQNFTVSSNQSNQRFILTNNGIDTTLLSVSIRPSELSSVSRIFSLSNNLFDVDSESPVFFIQEVEDERYELIFGDGIFGLKLQESNYITVNYVVSNGRNANSISQFNFSGSIVDQDDRPIVSGISLISNIEPSNSGSDIESVESIKKYSTSFYESRNRAVTASDYEALIPLIYPEAESVSVYGGEELFPPKFGKVFISIKPYNDRYLSNLLKDNIKKGLKKYTVAGIVPEIIDLKYLFIESTSNVYYNTNLVSSESAIKSIIFSNLNSYSNSTELNKFGSRFKYSRFLKLIDESDKSITSNITNIIMRRDLKIELNSLSEYEICFGNRFNIKNSNAFNIKSSGFNVSGILDTVYISDSPNPDLKTGSIFIFKLKSPTEPQIIKRNIGTIDYVKGEIILFPINITSTSISKGIPIVEISTSPYSNDVIGLQDLYLQLDINNAIINMIPDNIESKVDISGTNYIVSSSYSNGSFTR